jgi:tetratricopeptide (TPR) repeat protein
VINVFRSGRAPSKNRNDVSAGDRARDVRDWAAAVAHYQAYLTDNPADAGIWVQLGNCAKEAGDYAKSMTAYRSALGLRPDDADIHLQLGHLHKVMGRLNEAMIHYREALARDPSLSDARHEITRLDQAIASLPFLLPTTFLDLSRADTFDVLLEKAAQANPQDDPFRKYAQIIEK